MAADRGRSGADAAAWDDARIDWQGAGRRRENGEEHARSRGCRTFAPTKSLTYIWRTVEFMVVRFEWDERKARSNLKKHGISFEAGRSLLSSDIDYLEIYDGFSADEEDRFIAIGPVRQGVVVVVYTERVDDVIRIISVRRATKQETDLYRRTKRAIP